MEKLCECGCGEAVAPGRRFRRGHWSRTQENRERRKARRKMQEPVNPSGLCMCGCGQPVKRATENHPERGYYAGDFECYIAGHQVGKGPEHSKWKGGRYTSAAGYVFIRAVGHPHADKDGYVLEHRLVAEQQLGRPLTHDEHAHHINGIKNDNRPENIVVLTKQVHHRLHGTETLREYHAEHPDQHAISGRKGADARWHK